MTLPLRIGTRRSKLALAQSGMMQRAIGRALGKAEAEIETAVPLVEIVTTGDRVQDRRLMELGGKALFTKEIEEALLDGRIDIAIHSMKDVPAEQPEGLCIAAIPEREDARDAFISRDFDSFDALPFGARLGTASLRRQAQALALRPDLKVEMLRGNIDTRLRRAAEGDFDAILLAVSGMTRLGVTEHIREKLSLDAFLPAPGQGALARRGQEGVQRQLLADVFGHPQPGHAGNRQQNGVEIPLGGAAQPGVDIAPQHLDLQVGAQGQGLGLTAQAGGAQPGAEGQGVETVEVAADEGVARVLAFRDGGDAQALGLFGRHVLHRMDGDVDPAVQQGFLDLLGEQGLAAQLHQAAVLDAVAGGDDLDQRHGRFDLGLGFAQGPADGPLHHARLGQGQFGAPGADAEGKGHERCLPDAGSLPRSDGEFRRL